MRKVTVTICLLALASFIWVSYSAGTPPAPSHTVTVQAVAGRGAASSGNNLDANILVLVTDPNTGAAVTNLTQSDFTVVDHFALPGQSCGFSNNITGFNNVVTGAYHILVATHATNPPADGCKWVAGDYLGQVMVRTATAAGQAALRLTIP